MLKYKTAVFIVIRLLNPARIQFQKLAGIFGQGSIFNGFSKTCHQLLVEIQVMNRGQVGA